MTEKSIQSVVVPEGELETWSEDEQRFIMNNKSNFYVINALGEYIFYLTRSRADAQMQANEDYDGRYTIRTVKDSKTKSKLENGGQSVYATATRPKGSSRPPRSSPSSIRRW